MRLFCTRVEQEWWQGEPIYEENQSVGFHRLWFLDVLAQTTDFMVSLQSKEGYFTKRESWSSMHHEKQLNAYTIHRTLLNNEFVLDFDEPEYYQNVYSFKVVYSLLHKLGYVPYIYFSGNKGLHAHFYLDYKILADKLDMKLQKRIVRHFARKETFIKRLTAFIVKKLQYIFPSYGIDGSLVHTNHLIRSEASLNKLGFKTFLGHTPEDVPSIAPIYNQENGVYPKLPFHHYCYSDAKIKYSVPVDLVKLCEEFVLTKNIGVEKEETRSLKDFMLPVSTTEKSKPCIQFFESPAFSQCSEGRKRALFVLASHYYDNPDQVRILRDWNTNILSGYLRDDTILAAARSTTGKVGCRYVTSLLHSLGQYDVCKGCQK